MLREERLEARRADLLLSFDEHAHVARQLAQCAQPRRHRRRVRNGAGLVVGGAPAVQAAASLPRLEGRRRPVLDDARGLHVVVRVEQHGRRVLPVHPLAEHVRRRAVDIALTNLLEARHFEDRRHRVGAALDVDGVGGVAAHARDAHEFAERRDPLLVLAVDGIHDGLDVGGHAATVSITRRCSRRTVSRRRGSGSRPA